MLYAPRRRQPDGRRSRSTPARWEDDTLPRAQIPNPTDQEDRDHLLDRVGRRHREAVRTSRSDQLRERLATHARAVAAIEAERAALDVTARREGACAWDGAGAAKAVARAAYPPPPPPPPPRPPRGVEASPATLALVQAENERLRRRVAELDAPVCRENEKLRERLMALETSRRSLAELEQADAARQGRVATLERAAAESREENARLTTRFAELGAADAVLKQRCAARERAAAVAAKEYQAALERDQAIARKEMDMLRQRIADLEREAAATAAGTEGLRSAAAGENERLRTRIAALERDGDARQKRVGVLQCAATTASTENERLLQRLRAAEKPSLAGAAESEKMGRRLARLECDTREAAAKHNRESDQLRMHCAALARQAQTAVAARDVAVLERDAAVAAKRAVPVELRAQYNALEKQLVVALTKLERSTRREDQWRRAFAESGGKGPPVL
jgi:hypothetical protein